MASTSSLSSYVDVSSKSVKGNLCLLKRKLEICCRHKMGHSYTSLSKEYNLDKLTIHGLTFQSED